MCARRARVVRERAYGAGASPSSEERVSIEPALSHFANARAIVNANEATRVFGQPDKIVVSSGLENVGLQEDVADAIVVVVVDAPFIFCGALEGDAAHELFLVVCQGRGDRRAEIRLRQNVRAESRGGTRPANGATVRA